MDIQPRYDCHGKTYMDVEDKLANWLLLNQDRTPIHVITGNSDKMRQVVMTILNDYNFKYVIPNHNQGMVIVL